MKRRRSLAFCWLSSHFAPSVCVRVCLLKLCVFLIKFLCKFHFHILTLPFFLRRRPSGGHVSRTCGRLHEDNAVPAAYDYDNHCQRLSDIPHECIYEDRVDGLRRRRKNTPKESICNYVISRSRSWSRSRSKIPHAGPEAPI